MDEGLPAITSIVLRVRFSGSPLHSRALMPKSEVKNERGRKLIRVEGLAGMAGGMGVRWYPECSPDITVKMVKTMTARD